LGKRREKTQWRTLGKIENGLQHITYARNAAKTDQHRTERCVTIAWIREKRTIIETERNKKNMKKTGCRGDANCIKKKENGICVRCSKPATHGLFCYECSIKQKRSKKKWLQKEKNKRHDRGLIPEYRKENNLCCYCGNPIDSNKHGQACSKCAEKMAEYSKRANKTYWRNTMIKK
jgi:hypothetical protein